MAYQDDLNTLIDRENTITNAKGQVSNFSYTQQAYTDADSSDQTTRENAIWGKDNYVESREQNIPSKDVVLNDTNPTFISKGIRANGTIAPQNVFNHFFGRCALNLNKIHDWFKAFLNSHKNSLGSPNGIATLNNDGIIPYSQLPENAELVQSFTFVIDTQEKFYLWASNDTSTGNDYTRVAIIGEYTYSAVLAVPMATKLIKGFGASITFNKTFPTVDTFLSITNPLTLDSIELYNNSTEVSGDTSKVVYIGSSVVMRNCKIKSRTIFYTAYGIDIHFPTTDIDVKISNCDIDVSFAVDPTAEIVPNTFGYGVNIVQELIETDSFVQPNISIQNCNINITCGTTGGCGINLTKTIAEPVSASFSSLILIDKCFINLHSSSTLRSLINGIYLYSSENRNNINITNNKISIYASTIPINSTTTSISFTAEKVLISDCVLESNCACIQYGINSLATSPFSKITNISFNGFSNGYSYPTLKCGLDQHPNPNQSDYASGGMDILYGSITTTTPSEPSTGSSYTLNKPIENYSKIGIFLGRTGGDTFYRSYHEFSVPVLKKLQSATSTDGLTLYNNTTSAATFWIRLYLSGTSCKVVGRYGIGVICILGW